MTGCSREPARQSTSASPTARYELKGKIVSIGKSAKQLTVDHQEIPGFMSAMTMAYPVKDERALDTLSPGDQISARVVGGSGSYWLEEIGVTKQGSTPVANQSD